MATIREYYDTDLTKCLSTQAEWQLRDEHGCEQTSLAARIYHDFDANAKYWSLYVPAELDVLSVTHALLRTPEISRCVLSGEKDTFYVESGFADYPERARSDTLVFTGRLFLYVDAILSDQLREQIRSMADLRGLHVLMRDRAFAEKRSEHEKPLAFISHDSRDKKALVRDLAIEMTKLMCPVWYDEFTLRVGDSLRESIERGLKETRKCVIVLSPNFLENEGWSKAEFDGIFTREIVEKQNVMLPVWHGVSQQDVYEYCPRLADRVGLDSSLGVEELARRLVDVVKHAIRE